MTKDLKHSIEECLFRTGYHPDYADGIQEKANKLAESLRSNPSTEVVQARMRELRSLFTDLVLMKGKYFSARVSFLSRLVQYLETRPEENVKVADFGCGTGVDLYVLDTLLGNKLTLTGIEINETSLSRARERMPDTPFTQSFSNETFDVIYSDFFSLGNNDIFSIAMSGVENLRALRSPGVVLHNADMKQISLYRRSFGARFSRVIPPELLAHIDEAPDCYFCRFEKD